MKAFLSISLVFVSMTIFAQKNIFLGNEFWNENTSIEEVKSEIDKGNSPTEFSQFNFDATAYAILNKAPLETILFLLEIEGNEVTKITHDARNYLMWAAYRGNYELTKILMEKGADIHILDDKGNNLQTFTAMGGVTDHRIYDLFTAYDLKLDAPNRAGATAIHYLAQHIEDVKAFDYFIANGFDIEAKDNHGNTVFHYASSQGNIELLDQLIAIGFNPKEVNDNNENALFFAAKGKRRFSNELPVFEYLVKKGLNPRLTNIAGNNLLHFIAASNKNENVYTYLIDQNLDIQKENDEGNNPLMIAAMRKNEVGLSILYARTKDKTIINDKGYNLLTYALRTKNAGLAERVLKAGLDFKIIDKSGDNLITHLVATFDERNRKFFEHYFEILQKKGVKVQDKTIHLATAMENEALVTILLNSKVDINAKNKHGLTALQLAAMKGHDTKFLRFLIEKGADKNTITDFDESVYDLAKSNELLSGDLEFLK
ncbi:hypothetical protein CW751_04735 [Brumimicrobium salinarum]|uniref:Uncharacterized protein n=1 Tax=Brumimicrobium salinarum TaxID=2058658 RepID=A0A2I0R462_9FLAO|nr:ankyrin repeat domain-containing protein [Brumimicrobium salinarum]PKR81366.1 hypothetical protein CW751_04735 [Brumimicrobium salinarum]